MFAISLWLLARAQGTLGLFDGWVAIGVGVGSGPYEAAFATLMRLYGRDSRNAIAGIALTLCFLAVAATDVMSASRRTATICLSLNRLFLMGYSLSKSHVHRNQWPEETGQVTRRSQLAKRSMATSTGGGIASTRLWLRRFCG